MFTTAKINSDNASQQASRSFFSKSNSAEFDSEAFFDPAPSAHSSFVQAKCSHCQGEENVQTTQRSSTGSYNAASIASSTPGSAPAVQAKLTIGPVDDPFEREADQVADEILRAPEPMTGGMAGGAGTDGDNSNHNSLVQAKFNQGQSRVQGVGSNSSAASSTLPASVLEYMEPRFGYDFSPVNIHVNSDVAPCLNARAFTVGSDIHFALGEFKPGTQEGKRLIGHELTHTIQQGAVPAKSGNPDAHSPGHISRAPLAIQREVGLDLVESSSNVLARIERRVSLADDHTDTIVRIVRALASAFPNANIPSDLRDLINNEALFRAGVGNLVRLIELALEFNPGAGRDSPLNRFVYTCNCGWIDMGHFFFSAVPAYVAGLLPHLSSTVAQQTAGMRPSEVALILGWFMEYLQEAFRQFYSGPFGGLLDRAPASVREAVMGNVRSVFTAEDLPSDKMGADIGNEVWGSFAFNFSPLNFGDPEAFDIHDRMTDFFSDCHAVFPTGQTRRAMVEETLGHPVDQHDILPRQHFSTEPVILTTALGLCPVPETECPPVDERGWGRSHRAGRIDESAEQTILWKSSGRDLHY